MTARNRTDFTRFVKDSVRLPAPEPPAPPKDAALAAVQPVLLQAVESLLRRVESHDYDDSMAAQAASFDPLRYIAEYLMRHNPAHAKGVQ